MSLINYKIHNGHGQNLKYKFIPIKYEACVTLLEACVKVYNVYFENFIELPFNL